MSGPVAFKRITVAVVSPAPSINVESRLIITDLIQAPTMVDIFVVEISKNMNDVSVRSKSPAFTYG